MTSSADGPTMSIAGLHHLPSKQDLADSLVIYNTLPHPEDQPEVSESTLNALGELFVHYGVQDAFGIHLLHSHFVAPKGTVLLGAQFDMSDSSTASWTKPVPVADLAKKSIHGHVFSLQSDGIFVPYEFSEGEAGPKATKADIAFFTKLADFLQYHNLADVVALEALDGSYKYDQTYMELTVGPQSTLLMNKKDVFGLSLPSITTGWSFEVGDDGIISCKGNSTYAEKVKGTHAVFVDSKPLPTVKALKEALRGEGIIA